MKIVVYIASERRKKVAFSTVVGTIEASGIQIARHDDIVLTRNSEKVLDELYSSRHNGYLITDSKAAKNSSLEGIATESQIWCFLGTSNFYKFAFSL